VGENLIDVQSFGKQLFYHLTLTAQTVSAETPVLEFSNSGIDAEKETIQFELKNFSGNKLQPLSIFVNGKLDHKFFPQNSGMFEEKISLVEGKNSVRLEFAGQSKEAEVLVSEKLKSNLLFGILVLLFSFFVFFSFVFSSKELAEKIALSITLQFVQIVATVFVLNYSGLLSNISFIAGIILESAVLAFLFRKNFKFEFVEVNYKSLHFLVWVALLALVCATLFFHIFSYAHYSYWNGFYERQSQAIFESGSIPLVDEFSYFGRGFTFVPGYFIYEAGLSWLTGLEETQIFALVMALGNLLFFSSIFYFGKRFGLSAEQSALIFFFLVFCLFILTGTLISPRHIISFALFIVAIAFMQEGKNFVLPALIYGFNGFVQFTMLAGLPIFYLVVTKKPDWKYLLKVLVPGFVLFALLFLPNLLNYGIPYEVHMKEWGYNITLPIQSLVGDVGTLLGIVTIFLVLDILWAKFGKKEKIDEWRFRLLVLVFGGFLIMMFASYRWNIFNSLVIALFFATGFSQIDLNNVWVKRLFLVIILVSGYYVMTVIASWTLFEHSLEPLDYMKFNSSSNEKILSDPLFGHAIAFYSRRQILADLYVEYADAEKLGDAYKFLEDKNYSVLDKYGITLTVNQADLINKTAVENKPLTEELEFKELDKIYSNGFISLHRVVK
ncbi:MAG: EpsG family protein, partial [Candidatus Diapherotrites archaeon]|nr:EpsG family protein [Candidatus Diapherotrites archaeon]